MQKKGDMSMKDGSPEYECLWRLQKRDMGYQDNVQKKELEKNMEINTAFRILEIEQTKDEEKIAGAYRMLFAEI